MKRHQVAHLPDSLSETSIICYKYDKPIRDIIFNFNKLVSDLDIHANTLKFGDCKDSKYVYQPAGHIVTGNLKNNFEF